jgi:NAD(P)-dependent dehydrogenase (short-subunit alcohol dehydrogenase family)
MLLDVFGTQEALDEMSAVHPIGRIGRPEEIADAVAWLFFKQIILLHGTVLDP